MSFHATTVNKEYELMMKTKVNKISFSKIKMLILEEKNGYIYYLCLNINDFGASTLILLVWHP